MNFSNPVPVAVALVPYRGKLVGVKRGIEPGKGMVALPGGYINSGETFHGALTRELFEETGIRVKDGSWTIFHVGDSLQSNRILIFGICDEVQTIDIGFRSDETTNIEFIERDTSLAFPLHEEARNKFFASLSS